MFWYNGKRSRPVPGVFLEPVQHLKCFLAGLFDDRVAQRGAVKDFLILGVDAAVLADHHVDIEVCIDEFTGCAGIRGCWQYDVTVTIIETTVIMVANMDGIPGPGPEIGERMVF